MPSSAPAPPALNALSLHDALPISGELARRPALRRGRSIDGERSDGLARRAGRGLRDARAGLRRRAAARGLRGRWPRCVGRPARAPRSEEHTSELQSRRDLVCRLLLPLPPPSTLFPYTTLFRSPASSRGVQLFGAAEASMASDRTGWLGAQVGACVTLGPVCAAARLRVASVVGGPDAWDGRLERRDRKSTRLNSSHVEISYAVFCSRSPRPQRSFPTRRSSDLRRARAASSSSARPKHRWRAIGRAGSARRSGPA